MYADPRGSWGTRTLRGFAARGSPRLPRRADPASTPRPAGSGGPFAGFTGPPELHGAPGTARSPGVPSALRSPTSGLLAPVGPRPGAARGGPHGHGMSSRSQSAAPSPASAPSVTAERAAPRTQEPWRHAHSLPLRGRHRAPHGRHRPQVGSGPPELSTAAPTSAATDSEGRKRPPHHLARPRIQPRPPAARHPGSPAPTCPSATTTHSNSKASLRRHPAARREDRHARPPLPQRALPHTHFTRPGHRRPPHAAVTHGYLCRNKAIPPPRAAPHHAPDGSPNRHRAYSFRYPPSTRNSAFSPCEHTTASGGRAEMLRSSAPRPARHPPDNKSVTAFPTLLPTPPTCAYSHGQSPRRRARHCTALLHPVRPGEKHGPHPGVPRQGEDSTCDSVLWSYSPPCSRQEHSR